MTRLRPLSMLSTHALTACAAALLTPGAHAQATGYTYKELVRPSGTTYCYVQTRETIDNHHPMNTRGDVAAVCDKLGGYNFGQSTLLGYNPFYPIPWYYAKPVLWTAGGTAKALGTSTKQTATYVAMQNNGDVVARLTTFDGKAMPIDPAAYSEVHWPGSTSAVTWQPCGNEVVSKRAASREGHHACWIAQPSRLVLSRPGQLPITLPPVPSPNGPLIDMPPTLLINDLGQVLVARFYDSAKTEAWLWDGQQWLAVQPPVDAKLNAIYALNNAGTVLLSDTQRNWYLWQAGQARQLSLDGATPYNLDDQERIYAARGTPGNINAPSQGLLRNGQFSVLETQVANWPSTWRIRRVLDSLADGRMLVEVFVDQKAVAGKMRLVMVNPK